MSIDLLWFLLTSVLFSEHKLNEHRFIVVLLTSVLLNEQKLTCHGLIVFLFITLFLIIPIYRWHCVVSHLSVFASITKRKQKVDCSLNVVHRSSRVSFPTSDIFPELMSISWIKHFFFNSFEFLRFRLPHMRVVLDIPVCNKACQ